MPGADVRTVTGDKGEQEERVRVHYWAAARDAAGVEVEQVPAGGLGEVLAAVVAAHPAIVVILRSCSIFVNGSQVAGAGARACAGELGGPYVEPGSSVEILPPFAGG